MANRTLIVILFFVGSVSALGACPSSTGEPADAGDTTTVDVPDWLDDTERLERAVGVATWNVRLFFDDVCDSGRCDWGDFEQRKTWGDFMADADRIASGMERLRVDVVLLEEIENERCMEQLRLRLERVYPYMVLGEAGWPASMDVAVASRYPITQVVSHRDEILDKPGGGTTTFARDFLEVHLDVEGSLVIVFAAHFKSKFSDDAERRFAEAAGARRVVEDVALRFPAARIVMGGDLNDVPGSPPLFVLETQDGLFRAGSVMPEGTDWTIIFRGEGQAIDHLFLPPQTRAFLLPSSVAVFRDDLYGYGGSDHAAIRALVSLGASPVTP